MIFDLEIFFLFEKNDNPLQLINKYQAQSE